MSRNILVLVVILLVATGGVYIAYQSYNTDKKSANNEPSLSTSTLIPTPTSAESSSSATNVTEHNVQITRQGFSPQVLRIKSGDTVNWTNMDTAAHTVNSDLHPTHTIYPALNKVGSLNPKESGSHTFSTAGTYRYHDHLNASLTGQVIVE